MSPGFRHLIDHSTRGRQPFGWYLRASLCLPARRVLAGLLLVLASAGAFAQELSPRAYWPAPQGTRILTGIYAYSWGEVVTDPALPVTGAESSINKAIVGYFHTLSILGRTSNVVVELPYAWGSARGIVFGQERVRNLAGLGDIGLTLSVNLKGAPSMTPAEFRQLLAAPPSILAASLKVVAPTGRYSEDRLVNVGANRWAAKAEVGYIRPLTPEWHLEIEAGAWFFGENEEFLSGRREQDPVYAAELHLVRRLAGGSWASANANFFGGGRTSTNGTANNDRQRNADLGVAYTMSIGRRTSLKFSASAGVLTEAGGHYRTLSVNYIRLL